MEVKKLDYEKDIDEAVKLCNKCFPNEVSKEYFVWKHKENPFGRSYGLVAIEEEKIIGLRMFMKWKFSSGDKILNALRPVDTCTHPDYRGKGIFKKLTLKGITETKGEYDFIFNTPNSQSIDGYLGMGWQKFEKPLHYRLGFVNLFSIGNKFDILDINDMDLDNLPTCNSEFSTQLSQKYLKWRYKFLKYKIAKFQDQTIVVFRLVRIKGLKVLILLELCGAGKNINSYLSSLALDQGAFFIYYLRNEKLKNIDFPVSLKRGKQNVVVKDDNIIKIKHLNFSAGDLEGIL